MINFNTQAAIKEVRTRAENRRKNIVLEDEFKPRTDRNNIYLQRPQPHWSKRKWDLWWYCFEHELGHIHPNTVDVFDMCKEKQVKQGFLSYVINMLDDHRQELNNNSEYYGRQKRLDTGRQIFYDDKCLNQDKTGQPEDDHRLAAEALFAWDAAIREDWQPSVTGYGDKFKEQCNEQQIEWINKLHAGDYEDTLKSGINAYQEYDLAIKIIEEVFNFDSEQEKQDAQGNRKMEKVKKEKSGGEGDTGRQDEVR